MPYATEARPAGRHGHCPAHPITPSPHHPVTPSPRHPLTCWWPALALLALALFGGMPANAAGEGKEAVLDRCEQVGGWGLNAGMEFPGATGAVALAEDPAKGKCLRLDYDFSGGGMYVTAERALDVPPATEISFLVRQEGGNRGFLRLADSTEQEHAGGFAIQGEGWQKVVVPLDEVHFGPHWHGANDGKFHFPLTRMVIGASKGPSTSGRLFIKDLAFRTTDPSFHFGFQLSTSDPGNVVFTRKGTIPVTLLLENRLDETNEVTLDMSVEDWHGGKRALPVERIALPARGRAERRVMLDGKTSEYYRVSAEVLKEGKRVAGGWTGVVVTEKPRNFGVDDPHSFFGIQASSNPARTERLGVKWVRAGTDWRWGEMIRGRFQPGSPRRYRENHQLVMYCMTAYPPSWAEQLAGQEPFWEGPKSDERIALWANFVEQTARLYAPLVDTFEVQNEPDLTCLYQVGLKFDQGVERYLKILRAAAPAIRRGAPNARVAGVDVSGGDYDVGLPYSNAVMERAGSLIDVYTGHPYAGVRYFGEGKQPMWPVRNEERRKCLDTRKMIARFGGKQHFWVGEKGWGLDVNADALSEYSRDFARCLVQSMVVAHSVPGVERYYWFLEEGCNEGGNEYGLFRRGQALPAALAYATLARMLHHARPLASPEMGAIVQAHCFVSSELRQGTLVLWSESDRATLDVARMPAAWSAFDVMGREVARGSSRKPLRLTFDHSPIYVRFPEAAAQAVCDALPGASVTCAEPVKLESAYVADLGHLAARLRNVTRQPVACEVAAGAVLRSVTVPGGKSTTVPLPFAGLAAGAPVEVPVRLRAPGTDVRLNARVDLATCPRVPDIAPDGSLAAWESRPGFVLDQRGQVLPSDPTVGWNGPEDLSIRAWVGWNERHLLFTAAVRDDVHSVDSAEASGYWNSDSLQIGIDPRNDASPSGVYDPDDVEFGMVLPAEGPRVYESVPNTRRLEIPCFAARKEGVTLYQVAIPWSRLGITPKPGLALGLDFILNDNDGSGRSYWMGLTPGIGEGKRPWVFKDLVLGE